MQQFYDNGSKNFILVIALLLLFLFGVDGLRSLVLILTGKDDPTAVAITNFVITLLSGTGGGGILYGYLNYKSNKRKDNNP